MATPANTPTNLHTGPEAEVGNEELLLQEVANRLNSLVVEIVSRLLAELPGLDEALTTDEVLMRSVLAFKVY